MTKFLKIETFLFSILAAVVALTMIADLSKVEAAPGGVGEKFVKVVYLKYGGSASNSGSSYSSPKPFVDGDLWAIPAGAVIEKVYMIVDTAITGTTALTIGDDDGAASFCPNASVTLGTPGMYCWDAKGAGAYLRIQTAGASDAADIYVVPNAKLYSASGKEVKLDITTANTAGAARVFIEGYYSKPQ